MKIEEGVMVVKNGKGWGQVYDDGKSSADGWMEIESAPIRDARFCQKPTDVTYKSSPYFKELLSAKVVRVVRKTEVHIIEDTESPSCS